MNLDTPAARHNRPEGNGLTWADIQAHADACLWQDCAAGGRGGSQAGGDGLGFVIVGGLAWVVKH